MGNSPVDRDKNYVRELWGTTKLVTNYYRDKEMTANHDFLDNLGNDQHQKMLREIANDKLTPKKSDKIKESEIFDPESDPEPLFG